MQILALDVVIPLAVFYAARAAGLDQWLSLVLAAIAPAAGIALTWSRQRKLDPTAVFMIAAMALSLLVAMISGDPRALLARESWVTGALGIWMLASLLSAQPFLFDIAVKVSSPAIGARIVQLWQHNPVFHRWFVLASVAWGSAFVLDAVARVVMAYTLPVDSVPLLATIMLVAAIVVAQGLVMLSGRRSGALAMMRDRA